MVSFFVSSFGNFSRICDRRHVLQRIAKLAPPVEASLQRPDVLHAFISEQQRHTGAGSFVGSSTVENHLAVAWQAFVFLLEFAGVHAESSGDRFRVGLEVDRMPEIDDRKRLAGVDLFL